MLEKSETNATHPLLTDSKLWAGKKEHMNDSYVVMNMTLEVKWKSRMFFDLDISQGVFKMFCQAGFYCYGQDRYGQTNLKFSDKMEIITNSEEGFNT